MKSSPKPAISEDVVRFLLASRVTPGHAEFLKHLSAEVEYLVHVVATIRGDADTRAHTAGALAIMREMRDLFTNPSS